MDEDGEIKVRFIDIAEDHPLWPPATTEQKDRVLERLGIKREPDQPPLSAWVLAMCRENGLPEQVPAYEIGAAIADDKELARFIWWLA